MHSYIKTFSFTSLKAVKLSVYDLSWNTENIHNLIKGDPYLNTSFKTHNTHLPYKPTT